LIEYLTSIDEQHAATWFENNWTGTRGRWMLGYLGINAAITNNGLESTWKQLKSRCSYRQGTTHLHNFLPAMFWFLEDRTQFARDRMEEQGDPHNFLSEPIIGRNVWEHLQKWRVDVLLRCRLADGNDQKWTNFVCAMDEERRERERLIPVLTRIRGTDHMKLIPRDVKRT